MCQGDLLTWWLKQCRNQQLESHGLDLPLGKIFVSISFFQTISKVSVNLNSVIWWIKFDIRRSVVFLALENSWLFTIPPLVSPRNDMWATAEEIPYWWHSLPRSGYLSWLLEAGFPRNRTNEKHYSEPGSDMSSVWDFCSYCLDVILRKNGWSWCKMFAVISCLVVNIVFQLLSDVTCALINREFKLHVWDKWQTSESSWESFKIENEQMKTA